MLGDCGSKNQLCFHNFLIGGFAGVAALFQAFLDHGNHGTVLVRGHPGQGPIGIANALKPAQLARGES